MMNFVIHLYTNPFDPGNNKMIEDASLEHLGRKLRLKETTIKEVLDPMVSIRTRTLTGGPAPENSRKSIAEMKMGVEVDKECSPY